MSDGVTKTPYGEMWRTMSPEWRAARPVVLQSQLDTSLRAGTVLTIKLGEAIKLLTPEQHVRYLTAIDDIEPDGSRRSHDA